MPEDGYGVLRGGWDPVCALWVPGGEREGHWAFGGDCAAGEGAGGVSEEYDTAGCAGGALISWNPYLFGLSTRFTLH